ncbi:hypothetical protein [Gryllotalpicola sp.]|uniref:hypothetical protein n=1 Tax=Gryllotalpicola sp. TaxID=1932787 RepID=UPI00263447A8|nr:hypothetical protein [Gryllotalpicola sp.]
MTTERITTPARKPRRRKKVEFVEHLSGDDQMLLAFPWTKNLSRPERAEFAEALASHPADISNTQLEALIVSWKERALGQRAA